MIIVIFLVCLVAIILGGWLADKDCELSSSILLVCGVLGGVLSFVAAIILLINISLLGVIDSKIVMYQEENKQIESQVSECVQQYQQYETGIFTEVSPKSSITLVALYPELKADSLVAKQIEIYVANNQKVKELKEKKINGSAIRWWVYFGGSNDAESH